MRRLVLVGTLAACAGVGRAGVPFPVACAQGDVVVHGACVGRSTADRYCGPAARWGDGACEARTCGGAQVIDEVTGACLGTRDLRAVAERQHVMIDEEHVAGCDEGAVLRVAASHLRCAPRDTSAPPRDRCGSGSVLDVSSGRCLPLTDDRTVDVVAWARAVLGAPEFCAKVTSDPAAYGTPHGATSFVDLDVDLVLPDNDVTLVRARARATEEPAAGARRGVSPAADALIERALVAEADILRAIGGASVSTHVRCVVHGGSAPFADMAQGP
jgi:hypothetical protein